MVRRRRKNIGVSINGVKQFLSEQVHRSGDGVHLKSKRESRQETGSGH